MAASYDMTVGNPTRCIINFSLPLIGGYILQQLYVVADAAIVGRCIGVEALAAVGAPWAVMFLVLGFCNGACAGFAIPVAHSFGAGEQKMMRQYAANSILLAAAISIPMAAVVSIMCRRILILVSTPEEILGDAYIFLLLQALSIPLMMAYNMLASLLRAVGNSRQPFYFLIMASILNILLAATFIIICHMGVAGVGLATMISQGAAAAACWIYINKYARLLQPKKEEWRPSRKKAAHLLANGVPMGLQFSITGIGIIMLQTANNSLGTVYVAAFTASMRVKYLFTCVFENIGVAMATYCGQNIGAGKVKRIASGIWSAILISMVHFLISLALILPLADEMMLLFTDSTNTGVITNAAMLMRIACWFYPVLGVLTVLRYSIQGLGWSELAVCSGVMEMLARGGVSLWLVPSIHFLGVCYGDPVAWMAADIFLIPTMIWLYKRRLKQQVVKVHQTIS